MFGMVYRKRIRLSLRNPSLVVWTLLFPMGLATFFYLAFGSLDEKNTAAPEISAAVVADAAFEEEPALGSMLTALEEESVLAAQYTDKEEALRLLEEGTVCGLIRIEDGKPALTVRESGMEQTILKNILDQYLQSKGLSKESRKPEAAEWVREVTLTEQPPSEQVTYFYALLAMSCMYGGLQGVVTMSYLQANMSPLGMRRSIAPVKPFTVLMGDLLGGYTVQAMGILAVLAYMLLALGVNVGGRGILAAAVCLAGSLLGVLLGAVTALPSRWKLEMKVGITISVAMVCCFLAGMMVHGLNYTIKQRAPFLDLINPAARISDALRCLYYYSDTTVFWENMGALGIMSGILLGILLLAARRREYGRI